MPHEKWRYLAKGLQPQNKEKRYALSENRGGHAETIHDTMVAIVVNGGTAHAAGSHSVALALGSQFPDKSLAVCGTDGASIAWGEHGTAEAGVGGTAIGLGCGITAKTRSYGSVFSFGNAEGGHSSKVIAGIERAAKAGPCSLIAIFYQEVGSFRDKLAVGYTATSEKDVVSPCLTPNIWYRVDRTGRFYECPPP